VAKIPKPKAPTIKQLRWAEAETTFTGVDFDTPEKQSEAAKWLQSQYKFTRQEIANFTGITFRTVQTRLKQYPAFVLSKAIPTGILDYTEEPFEEVVEDALESRVTAAAAKQAKADVAEEILMQKIVERIAPLLPIKPDLAAIDKLFKEFKPNRVKGRAEEVMVATMSDLHLCLANESHSYERGLEANRQFMKTVIRLADLHRANFNVTTLHINALGDLIQGTANYPSQKWDVDRPAVDQAEAITEVMVENIEVALLHFEKVVINWGNGNHEYIVGKKVNPDPAHSSWGQVAVRALMWAFRHNKRVTFNVPTTWYQVVNIAGSKFMLTHGHAMTGSGTFDGIVATARKWADVVEPHDYLVMGHFHRLAKLPLPKVHGSSKQRAVYMNGTAVDSDDFIQQMGGSPVTQWWVFFVREGRGITAEHSVDLYE